MSHCNYFHFFSLFVCLLRFDIGTYLQKLRPEIEQKVKMLRSIPARRAIRTIGSNAKWMDVAGARGLSNRVKAAGGIMVEKKGTRAQATAAPQAARYESLLFASMGVFCGFEFHSQFRN